MVEGVGDLVNLTFLTEAKSEALLTLVFPREKMKKEKPEKPRAREVLESEQSKSSQCNEGKCQDQAIFCKFQ